MTSEREIPSSGGWAASMVKVTDSGIDLSGCSSTSHDQSLPAVKPTGRDRALLTCTRNSTARACIGDRVIRVGAGRSVARVRTSGGVVGVNGVGIFPEKSDSTSATYAQEARALLQRAAEYHGRSCPLTAATTRTQR